MYLHSAGVGLGSLGRPQGGKRSGRLVGAMIAVGFGLVSCAGSSSTNTPTGPVNIGVLGGLTGTTLTYGTALFEGTTIAANLINANGGIMNRQIHLIPINTASDPVDAVTAVRKMLAVDNVSGATGLGGLDYTTALPILNQSQMVEFHDVGDPAIDQMIMPYAFASRASDAVEGAAMADYAFAAGYHRAAVAFDSSASGQTLVPSLLHAASILGLQVVTQPTIPQGAPSYEAVVRQIVNANPDVILTQMEGTTAGTFFPELQQLGGANLPVIGTDVTIDPNWIKAAGAAEYAAHILSIQATAAGSGAGVDTFNTSFVATYNKPPLYNSAFAYDAVNVMALAMTDCKSTDPKVYVKCVLDVTTPGTGITEVYDFQTGASLLGQGKKIKYFGVATPMTFNKYHRVTATYAAQKGTPSGAVTIVKEIPATDLVPLI